MFHLSLAAARVNAGMSQKEAAAALKVSNNTIINWENGHCPIPAEKMQLMSEIYNAPITFLLPVEDKKDGSLKGFTKIVVETDAESPVTIATITEDETEVAEGYRVRLTPKYD